MKETQRSESNTSQQSPLIQPAIQNSGQSASDPTIDEILNDQYLTEEQHKFLSGIVELFDPADDIDSSILYECTGY